MVWSSSNHLIHLTSPQPTFLKPKVGTAPKEGPEVIDETIENVLAELNAGP
jgi:hypothetical protein